jgi:hypothetical protein
MAYCAVCWGVYYSGFLFPGPVMDVREELLGWRWDDNVLTRMEWKHPYG